MLRDAVTTLGPGEGVSEQTTAPLSRFGRYDVTAFTVVRYAQR